MGTDVTDGILAGELLALEETLWRSATRFDRAWMEHVLHPEFHEFGRSGRRWSRTEILSMTEVDIAVDWPPEQLTIALVAPGAALLTYVLVDPTGGAASNRSSLWLRADGSTAGPTWRLRFHQGSPTTV